jgi:hypothetical protein
VSDGVRMDENLAFRVGLLMGELAKKGVRAEPVLDENGFTDTIHVQLGEPFTHVYLHLKVSNAE